MMKISTSTAAILDPRGDEEGIALLAKAGFQALDFGMFYSMDDWRFQLDRREFEQYYRHLREVADDNGIAVGQVHSPMVDYLYTGDEEAGNAYFDLQVKAIRAASLLGAPYIVIHPVIPPQYRYSFFREETKEINRKYYQKLAVFLDAYGVKVGIENMWNWDPEKACICPTVCSTAEEMCDYVDMLGRNHAAACLDIGHAVLTGDTPEHMIRVLGDRLELLHIHDNNGKEDSHLAPYMGIIDWAAVCRALKETGYQGNFNFEADTFYTMFGNDLLEASAQMLRKIGESLVKRYEL